MMVNGSRHFSLGLVVAAVIALRATPVAGEVGVFVGADLKAIGGPYQILQIVEDPDGFPTIWLDVSASQNPNRVALNPQGEANGDGPPSAIMNTFSGLPTVAWAQNSPSGFDVVISHYTAGAWSTPEVLAGSSDDELDPYLVLDPSDGTVHVFYWVDDTTPVVMHRQAPADLSSWSDPVQVSDGAYPAFRPAGVVHNGVLKVIYEVHDYGAGQTPRQVVLAYWNGQDFIPQVMAISYYDGEMWPQVHSHQGRMWFEWIDADHEMAWIRLQNGGTWSPTQYETFLTAEELWFQVRGSIRAQAGQP